MSKKLIAILDVEGGLNNKPYNVGYIIGDCYGNIVAEKSYALMDCIWENLESSGRLAPDNVGRVMGFTNIQEILRDNVKYKWVTTLEFAEEFFNDLTKYNISEIWAYNAQFDKGAIEDRLLGLSLEMFGVKWYDIMKACVHNVCCSPKYLDFCIENNFVTEKGNIKSSAESVYAYSTKDRTFIEEHTGLADCRIEYKLYLLARKTKKKIRHSNGDWRTLKNYREKKGR